MASAPSPLALLQTTSNNNGQIPLSLLLPPYSSTPVLFNDPVTPPSYTPNSAPTSATSPTPLLLVVPTASSYSQTDTLNSAYSFSRNVKWFFYGICASLLFTPILALLFGCFGALDSNPMRKALFLRGVGLFLIMGGISLEIVMFSSAAGLDSTSTGFYVRIVLYACFASGLLVSIYGRYLFRQVMAQGHAVHHGGSGGGGGGGRTRAARVVLVGSVSPMLPM